MLSKMEENSIRQVEITPRNQLLHNYQQATNHQELVDSYEPR